MTEAAPDPSTSRRSGEPGPSRWSWPTTSSREAGRIRTASGLEVTAPGASGSVGGAPVRSNSPSDTPSGIPRPPDWEWCAATRGSHVGGFPLGGGSSAGVRPHSAVHDHAADVLAVTQVLVALVD